MGKNYYCEYCDKRMKNDINVRKKHFQGLPHKIAKANYTAAFKDPNEILEEESKKTPCTRFFSGKECKFGLFCNYSHYSAEQLEEIRVLVSQKDNLIKEINEGQSLAQKLWKYPYEKVKETNLPPSLQPLDLKRTISTGSVEWG